MAHVLCCFAYNRPDHTRRTLEALARCRMACETVLVGVVDGPKAAEDEVNVQEVRRLMSHAKGFREVIPVFRNQNFGTVRSLVPAITSVLEQYGAAIFVEDDVIVSEHFLDFMNSALDTYQREARVMSVSGYMFPGDLSGRLPETFFYRKGTSFSWATWDRAWQCLSMDCRGLLERLQQSGLTGALDGEGTFKLSNVLARDAVRGDNHSVASWSPRWFASMILAGGLTLYPRTSLSHNIGFDGTGVRSPISSAWDTQLTDFRPLMFPSEISEHPLAHAVMTEAYARLDRARFSGRQPEQS